MEKIMLYIIAAVYNLLILAGTAYLVVNDDWSSWWFAFSLLLLIGVSNGKDSDEKSSV